MLSRLSWSELVRILCQRWGYIVACLLLVAGATLARHIFGVTPRYVAAVEVIMLPRVLTEPLLRRTAEDGTLAGRLARLRDRVLSDRRLARAVGNLRLAVKERVTREEYPALAAAREDQGLETLLPPRQDLDARLALLKRMELASVARVAGLLPAAPEEKGALRFGLDEDDPALVEHLASQLGHRVTTQASPSAVRREVVLVANGKINARGGLAEGLRPAERWELGKELRSRDALAALALERVFEESPEGQRARARWVARLRRVVAIEQVGKGHVLRVSCEMEDAALAGDVARVVADLFRAEYAILEGEARVAKADDLAARAAACDGAMAVRRGRIQSELARLGLSWTPGTALPAADSLQEAFAAVQKEAAQVQMSLARTRLKLEELEARLADPAQRVVRAERVETVPDPAAEALIATRHAKEEELTSLLTISTEQHPFVRRLRRTIADLNRQVAASGTMEKVVIDERPHPKLAAWREARDAAELALRQEEQTLQGLDVRLTALQQRAEEAPAVLAQARVLQAEIRQFQRQAAAVESARTRLTQLRERPAEPVWMHFETHRALEVTSLLKRPSLAALLPWLLLGWLVCSLIVVGVVEAGDHSIKSVSDARSHFSVPVLAAVPEFGVRYEATAASGGWWQRLTARLRREEEDLAGSRQTLVERSGGQRLRLVAAVVLLLLLLLLGFLYSDLGSLQRWRRQAFSWFESAPPAEPEAAPDVSGAPPAEAVPERGEEPPAEAPAPETPPETPPAAPPENTREEPSLL